MVNVKNTLFTEHDDKHVSEAHKALVNEKPTLINYVAAIFA